MNRIKIPPPPSAHRERNGSPDWKAKLHEVVRQAIGYAARFGTLDQSLMKAVVIQAARLALSDLTNNELADIYEEAPEGERTVEEITLAIRHTVQHQVPHPISELMIETIMAEIQRAMDDEFVRTLGLMAKVLAARSWEQAERPPVGQRGEIVAQLMANAREALTCDMEVHRKQDPERGTMLSTVGALRSMLGGFDLSDPDRVQSLLQMIESSAEAELARAVPSMDS